MKKVFRNGLFLFVALLYVVSTMGYAVHVCTDDGTAQLILMYGESPCAHECESGCGHSHDHHHNHDKDCCSTDVYVLTQDQDLTDELSEVSPEYTLLCDYLLPYLDFAGECAPLSDFSIRDIIYSCKGADSQAQLCTFVI